MRFLRSPRTAGLAVVVSLALVPAAAQAGTGGAVPSSSGGTGTGVPTPVQTVPGATAKLVNGLAIAPASAPQEVKDVIAAANKIRNKPYIYGGGHGSFRDKGYDCSGSASFALHGGGLLDAPIDSSGMARYGEPGPGKWISVYGAPSHGYIVVAGLRYDTSMTPGDGPSWSKSLRATPESYRVRHPEGL